MFRSQVQLLACPICVGSLRLVAQSESPDGRVETGALECPACISSWAVVNHIPRFVPKENYASSFGYQWRIHARTQYDGTCGARVSEKRFFEETRWPRNLEGQLLLEAGSGSGRFTEQAKFTGATVVSVDYSVAVDANYASNGGTENVLIVQGDIYGLPLREGFFDKAYCFGVLQHTPDVRGAFLSLPKYLKRGGEIVVDVYRRYRMPRQLLMTKYWVRPVTRRLRPELLYRMTSTYVRAMWPLTKLISKLPLGRKINWALLVADYRGVFDMEDKVLRDWAILDTFDMLSPRYDSPQYRETLRQWFDEAGLVDVEVDYGYNGVEGRGRRV